MTTTGASYEASAPIPVERGERGFSLIEALIASLLLLFVALSLIPVFTMAASSNVQAQDNTALANMARERFEELWRVPFNDPTITITSGTERFIDHYLDPVTKTWQSFPIPTNRDVQYTRRTRIRQFGADDMTTPVSGEEAAENAQRVQIKEFMVEIRNLRTGSALGGGKRLAIVAFKSV